MRYQTVLPLFFFLFLMISPAFAISANITPTGDSQVYQNQPTTNYGTTNNFAVQSAVNFAIRGILLFNTSTIPAGSTISSATVNIFALTRSGVWNTKNYLVYNASMYNGSGTLISETNVTWNNQPALGTLLSNTSVTNSTGLWRAFDVTSAVTASLTNTSVLMVLIIKDNNETSQASANNLVFSSREYTQPPYLEVTFTTSNNCNTTIIGSYCDPNEIIGQGFTRGIVTTPDYTCNNDKYYVCPEGSVCGQITPQVNVTTPLVENFVDCSVCWFAKIYSVQNGWKTLWTNCPNNPECDNCNGIYCQGNNFVTNLTSTPSSASYYTAGCFNPAIETVIDVIDQNGNHTNVQNLTQSVFPGSNYTYNGTCANTSSVCFDASCNQITCPNPSSAPASSMAGSLALAFGSIFGITDLAMSEWIFSMFISLAIGFFLLYYTRDSEHAGQAFIVGMLAPLTMFTLISWFPGWVMILLIVLCGYLIAKSLGIGGGH